MTPFMLKVSEALDLQADIDLPEIRSSRHQPAATGTDEHVECRSLAEQLVCEANVVLSSNGRERLALDDDMQAGALSFHISFEGRQARIVTNIGHSTAVGHLYGVGARHLGNVELTGADQVEQLILLLIGSDRPGLDGTAVPANGTLAL
ncbi:hypothetical protein [Mycobacterium sp. TY815]|uniref:hypothetical protein n=1 Tax=Mycobacterium sp. TY815 TaxID=3050581 RepID=UPI0027423E3D|nr:hypothetical protein [Mycobacterium sp. TY815]MDP7704818.1 hypothetical protein [Mycobacterium sp. TY815]